MSASMEDRLVYTDPSGEVHCIGAKALITLPAEFEETVATLCADLRTARDCALIFGGIPRPVAKAILRNLEPAQAAFDLAMQTDAERQAN